MAVVTVRDGKLTDIMYYHIHQLVPILLDKSRKECDEVDALFRIGSSQLTVTVMICVLISSNSSTSFFCHTKGSIVPNV